MGIIDKPEGYPIEDVSRWVVSPEEQRALQESLARARELSKRFEEASRISPDLWLRLFQSKRN